MFKNVAISTVQGHFSISQPKGRISEKNDVCSRIGIIAFVLNKG